MTFIFLRGFETTNQNNNICVQYFSQQTYIHAHTCFFSPSLFWKITRQAKATHFTWCARCPRGLGASDFRELMPVFVPPLKGINLILTDRIIMKNPSYLLINDSCYCWQLLDIITYLLINDSFNLLNNHDKNKSITMIFQRIYS